MLATFFKVVEKTPDVLVYYWTVDRTRTYPDADEFERLVQRDGPSILITVMLERSALRQ